MSQELDPTCKVQADSIADVKSALHACARRLTDDGVRFRGRVLRPGPLLNALVAHFVALDDADQARVAEEGMAGVLALMAREAPIVGDVQSKEPAENDRIVATLRDAIRGAAEGRRPASPNHAEKPAAAPRKRGSVVDLGDPRKHAKRTPDGDAKPGPKGRRNP